MEELLRTRKLSSASARKRKIQERQDKIRESKQRNLDRRDTAQFRYGYGYCSDEEELSDNEGNHNTFSPIAEGELDPPAAIASPSTAGARTPDNLPSPPYVDAMQAWPDIDTRVASVEDSTGEGSTKLDIPPERGAHLDLPTPTSAKPVFQSTLTSLADFTFDLYPPDFARDEALDPDLDLEIPDLEPDTPIEIATPIIYSQPRTRPSVISISIKNPAPSIKSRQSSSRPSISSLQPASSPPRSSKRPSVISSHYTSSSITSRKSFVQYPSPSLRSLTLPASYDRRMSNTSIGSGYPACEATPLDLSAPPVPLIRPEILANASRESLLEGLEDRRTSSHVKKPSVINNLRKSGLNNIMSYVKDAKTPVRESVQSRPTTAVSNYEVDESNMKAYPAFVQHRDDYPAPLRPRTATTASTRSWGENSVTALPTPPEPPMPSIVKSSTFEVARKKSFSALRNRSSSIGKALRSASSSVVPTISTLNYPGKPSISLSASSSEAQSRNQSRKASMDLASFPIPPPSPLMFSASRNSSRMSPSIERGGFAWPKVEAR
jgi:hypothetical protein